jgi:hypothetical protein
MQKKMQKNDKHAKKYDKYAMWIYYGKKCGIICKKNKKC